jgi:hypothetical protein
MRTGPLRAGALVAVAAGILLAAARGDAHKPITSPYTFNEDVFPIVEARCGSCHYSGGPAPMSLLTHADAVPWGESIRAELMAGHMPPWRIEGAPWRFRNVQGLTGRELNVLLTWASGGTPPGDPDKAPAAASRGRQWPLGSPDLVVPMPREARIAADVQEQVVEFVVRPELDGRRAIRAVDLLPGTPAIVRSAAVLVKSDKPSGQPGAERLIALWLPGDHPVPLDSGMAFDLPPGADLIVRVRYRKTWEHENREMSDRSSLGLYFAEEPAAIVEALELAGAMTAGSAQVLSTTIAAPMRAVALYPDPDSGNAAVTVVAIRPDNSREELIAFRPRAGWARRYWFREPLALPRGTRIDVTSRVDDALLPPGATPPNPQATPGKVHLTLNVLPGT